MVCLSRGCERIVRLRRGASLAAAFSLSARLPLRRGRRISCLLGRAVADVDLVQALLADYHQVRRPDLCPADRRNLRLAVAEVEYENQLRAGSEPAPHPAERRAMSTPCYYCAAIRRAWYGQSVCPASADCAT